jgi:hypothetical protein
LGSNVVIYALLNPDEQMRMAYGFNCDAGNQNSTGMEMRAMEAKLQKTNSALEAVAGKTPRSFAVLKRSSAPTEKDGSRYPADQIKLMQNRLCFDIDNELVRPRHWP